MAGSGKHFCLRDHTWKKVVKISAVKQDNIVFYDSVVILGALKKSHGKRSSSCRLPCMRKEILDCNGPSRSERGGCGQCLQTSMENRSILWMVEEAPQGIPSDSGKSVWSDNAKFLRDWLHISCWLYVVMKSMEKSPVLRGLGNWGIRNEAILPEDEHPGPVSGHFCFHGKGICKNLTGQCWELLILCHKLNFNEIMKI